MKILANHVTRIHAGKMIKHLLRKIKGKGVGSFINDDQIPKVEGYE